MTEFELILLVKVSMYLSIQHEPIKPGKLLVYLNDFNGNPYSKEDIHKTISLLKELKILQSVMSD